MVLNVLGIAIVNEITVSVFSFRNELRQRFDGTSVPLSTSSTSLFLSIFRNIGGLRHTETRNMKLCQFPFSRSESKHGTRLPYIMILRLTQSSFSANHSQITIHPMRIEKGSRVVRYYTCSTTTSSSTRFAEVKARSDSVGSLVVCNYRRLIKF